MSLAKAPGNNPFHVSSQEGADPLDAKSVFETDDLDPAASLSYLPLNGGNPAQSTASLPLQHDASVNSHSQTRVVQEGLPPQVYSDSHPQSQSQSQSQRRHSARNSSWDLLGGARKLGHAYEQFDSRHASQDHLAFADGDLPNSKVSAIGCTI